MQFLDNESEMLLQKCLENETDYPKILRDELNACDNHIKESNLRSIIQLLVNEGFLSKDQSAARPAGAGSGRLAHGRAVCL